MDKDEIKIIEIRVLLDRFYAGETTRSEEERLRQLLFDGESLPAALETDRRLFLELNATAESGEDLHASYETRISDAIGKAAAKDRHRRWMAWGSVAAACLAAAIVLPRVLAPYSPGPSRQWLALDSTANALAKEPIHALAQQLDTALSLPMNGEISAGDRQITGKRKTASSGHEGLAKATKASQRKPKAARETETWERHEEVSEETYEYSSRRVVEDPREAEAIVSAVFAEVEGNISFERAYVTAVCDNMDMGFNTF